MTVCHCSLSIAAATAESTHHETHTRILAMDIYDASFKSLISIFLIPNCGLANLTIAICCRVSMTSPSPKSLCFTRSPASNDGQRY